jgi:predicted enzyme related to lactoylglutathione lyase
MGRAGRSRNLDAISMRWGRRGKAMDRVAADRQVGYMAIRVQCLCIDSNDPDKLALFWEDVLGWRRTYARDDEVVLEPPAGSPEDGVAADLLFLRVPEPKSRKNRLHLDLRPDDQRAEVERIEALGARRVSVGQDEDASWVVLADPEGNEFCVLRALTPQELADA